MTAFLVVLSVVTLVLLVAAWWYWRRTVMPRRRAAVVLYTDVQLQLLTQAALAALLDEARRSLNRQSAQDRQ